MVSPCRDSRDTLSRIGVSLGGFEFWGFYDSQDRKAVWEPGVPFTISGHVTKESSDFLSAIPFWKVLKAFPYKKLWNRFHLLGRHQNLPDVFIGLTEGRNTTYVVRIDSHAAHGIIGILQRAITDNVSPRTRIRFSPEYGFTLFPFKHGRKNKTSLSGVRDASKKVDTTCRKNLVDQGRKLWKNHAGLQKR